MPDEIHINRYAGVDGTISSTVTKDEFDNAVDYIKTKIDGCNDLINLRPTYDEVEVIKTTYGIPIRYFNDDVKRLTKISKGDWIDLYCAEETIVRRGEFALVPLGLAMQLPKGYEAYIAPRSATFKNWGVIQTNSIGIVDETYCGDNDQWLWPCYCLKPNSEVVMPHDDDPKLFKWLVKRGSKWAWRLFPDLYEECRCTVIKAGDKICQFRIMHHMQEIAFIEKETLGNKDRGGHGSTGTV